MKDEIELRNAANSVTTPGLRISVPRSSLVLLSGLVGLGTLGGCAGAPLRFQDRFGDDLDSLPTWNQIVESEKAAASESQTRIQDSESGPGPEPEWETSSDSAPSNLSDILFGKSRAPASVEEVLPDEVRLGMTEDEVLSAWGEPREVEFAGSGAAGSHRFIYPTSVLQGIGEERIVYFEAGRVAGWETVRR